MFEFCFFEVFVIAMNIQTKTTHIFHLPFKQQKKIWPLTLQRPYLEEPSCVHVKTSVTLQICPLPSFHGQRLIPPCNPLRGPVK